MHLVPLIPGWTIPLSHTILLLLTLLLAQVIHEVGGHALAALSVCLSRKDRSNSTSSNPCTTTPPPSSPYSGSGSDGSEDEGGGGQQDDDDDEPTRYLPRAVGMWIPFPAWLVAAFVVFPSGAFGYGRGQNRRHRPGQEDTPTGLHLRYKLRILAGGIAANLVTVLAFIVLVGLPTSFAPRPGALVVPPSLFDLVHSTRLATYVPGGSQGGLAAVVRWVGWNQDPLTTWVSLTSPNTHNNNNNNNNEDGGGGGEEEGHCTRRSPIPCQARGGLRIVKIERGSPLEAATSVVGPGSILLSLDQTPFYSLDEDQVAVPSSGTRLQAFAQAIYEPRRGTSTQTTRGWCIASSVWDPNPSLSPPTSTTTMTTTSSPARTPAALAAEDLFAPTTSTTTTNVEVESSSDLFGPGSSSADESSRPGSRFVVACNPDHAVQGSNVCFRDDLGQTRSLDALALVAGQSPFGHFAGISPCTNSNDCRTFPHEHEGSCIYPTVPLVQLTFLTPSKIDTNDDQANGGGIPSQTLLLVGTPSDVLSGVTVSPYVPRKWISRVLPSSTNDGWLMFLELGCGYTLLTALSLALLNALPLPGLDGSTIVWVILDYLATTLLTSAGGRRTSSDGPTVGLDSDSDSVVVDVEQAATIPHRNRRRRRRAPMMVQAARARALVMLVHRVLQGLTILAILALILRGVGG